MKFICLKYLDKDAWDATADAKRIELAEAGRLFDLMLRESGHLFATEGMLTKGSPVGLRSRNGQLAVEDESKTGARPFLNGMMFLEARDLNHAIVLITDHPGISMGWFEIHTLEERNWS